MQDLSTTNFHKLLFNSRKAREILSVNKNSRVNIENFFEDAPLNAKVQKEDYDKHCEEEYKELQKILEDFQ